MNRAAAWNVRGVEAQTRNAAEDAARRAGMSLGEWLDEVVADHAAEQGVDPADFDREARLDVIGERLARLSRREAAPERTGRRQYRDALRDEARPRPRLQRSPRERAEEESASRDRTGRDEPDQDMLGEAIVRLEERLVKSDKRANRVLESVTEWMEQSQNGRGDQQHALESVVDKLDGIEARLAEQQKKLARQEAQRLQAAQEAHDAQRIQEAQRAQAARAKALDEEAQLARRLDETTRNLDRRLQQFSERISAPDAAKAAPAPAAPRARHDLKEAVIQLAQRRSAAEFASTPAPETSRLGGLRNFGVDLPTGRARAPSEASPAPRNDHIIAELERLNRRAESLRAQPPATAAPNITGLRTELAAMSRSLSELAPRNAIVALEGAIQDLSSRVNAIGDRAARENLRPPLEGLVAELRQSLSAHDPKHISQNLEREIRAIGAKVDAISRSAIDPDSFERIRQQTEEVRNLLSAAAQRPVPVERLEKQIGDLADRIEAISASASPQRDSADVLMRLADVRAQVERSTPTAALSAIERRLEQLASRIDQALARPQPAPGANMAGLEDIARRMEAMRDALERRPNPTVDSSGLEKLVHQLDTRLAQPNASNAASQALEALLRDMNAKLDSAAPPAYDPRLLKSMFHDLGERIDRRSPPMLDTRGLERALHEVHSKLAESAPPDLNPILRQIAGLHDRFDDLQTKNAQKDASAPAASEAIIREIASLHERFNILHASGAKPTPADPAASEAILREIGGLYDRLDALQAKSAASADPTASNAILREIAALRDRIEENQARATPAGADMAASEAIIREIAGLHDRFDDLQAKHAQPVASSPAAVEAIIREIAGLHGRFDELHAHGAQTAPPDPAASEALLREIGGLHRRFDALQAQSALRPDTAASDAILREIGGLHDRLDVLNAKRGAPADPAASEAILREIGGVHDRLDALHNKSAAPADPAASETILREIRVLRDQIEAMQSGAAAAERGGADAIIREIAGLHDRFDRLQANDKSAAGVEPLFGEILGELGQMRQSLEATSRSASIQERYALNADSVLARDVAGLRSRLDDVQARSQSLAASEPMIADIMGELARMRATVEGVANRPAQAPDNANFMRGIDELRSQQAEADRLMQSNLGGVHAMLENIVDRIADIEDARLTLGASETASSAALDEPLFDRGEIRAEAEPRAAPTIKMAVSAIPDRDDSHRIAKPEKAPPRSLDGSNFLIEPGASPLIGAALEEDRPATSVNAHIAAARRAAQAAMAASDAAERERAEALKIERGEAGARGIGRAKAYVMARKRPLLLGVALVAATTFAYTQWSGPHPAAMQKSELDLPLPANVAQTAKDNAGKSEARATDATPVGSIATAKVPSVPNADQIATLPQGLPSALHDALAHGERNAEYELAMRFVEGRGVTRDPHLAAQWMQNAADQGLPPAQYRLASFYEKGVGLSRDIGVAKGLYLSAANAGNARAMHNLAVLAAEANGVKPDYLEASNWFRKAGALGIKDSQYNLGILYARGMGVSQDLGQAWLWFSLAAQQGDTDAAKKRDEVGVKMDAKSLAAATASLAAFKPATPVAFANDVGAPIGGWDGVKGTASQADPKASASPSSSPM